MTGIVVLLTAAFVVLNKSSRLSVEKSKSSKLILEKSVVTGTLVSAAIDGVELTVGMVRSLVCEF